MEPTVSWESPHFKTLEALCWKSFLSHIQLGTAGIFFLCESCVDQMTKAYYRDNFSAAAHMGLLQCHMFQTIQEKQKLSLFFFLVHRLTEEVGTFLGLSVIGLSNIFYIFHLLAHITQDCPPRKNDSISHSSKWPLTACLGINEYESASVWSKNVGL